MPGDPKNHSPAPREPRDSEENRTTAIERRLIQNGENGVAPDDTVEAAYATTSRQAQLKQRIESQELPVRERLQELTRALVLAMERKGIVLFQGETGSGKSVYSPFAVWQALQALDLPDSVVMMQPRRDAASGIARAVAALLDEEIGRTVGFATSEFKSASLHNALRVVTPGIFLRYLREGSLISDRVGALILDELHEATIEYHLALGLIKMMRARGEAPLTLLTSATLEKERTMQFFGLGEEDYLKIEGRTYPVEKLYLKPEELKDKHGDERNYLELTAEKIKTACASGLEGDVLVFLPGAREILDVIKRAGEIDGVEMLPLFGALGPEDRDRAVLGTRPPGIKRRVIVATNIAETSLTIPGIKTVIDSCCQRSVRYNPRTEMNDVGTELISKDQAEQRAGRAGRVSEGVCYRMITEEGFKSLAPHTESEIRRKNLAETIFTIKGMKLDPRVFPFIDPPAPEAINHGIQELKELGALDESEDLTPLGKEMAALPFGPNLARAILEAKRAGCAEAALVLASFERETGVLVGPSLDDVKKATGWNDAEKRKNARIKVQELQARFARGGSDLLQRIAIFAEAIEEGVFEAARHDRSPAGKAAEKHFYEWCRKYYLKPQALTHVAHRMRDYAQHAGVRIDFSKLAGQIRGASDESLGTALLAGYPNKLIVLRSSGRGLPEYGKFDEARSEGLNLSPGSVTFSDPPRFCITADDISPGKGTLRGQEIKRNYASGIHPVTLAQMKKVLPHLLTKREMATQYNPAADQVETKFVYHAKGSQAYIGEDAERASGEKAAEAFARALARGEVDLAAHEFNLEVFQKLEALRSRSGGRVETPRLTEWYAARLGDIASRAEAEKIDSHLRLSEEDFCPEELLVEIQMLYPETIAVRGRAYQVAYKYLPPGLYASASSPHFSARIIFPGAAEFLDIGISEIPWLGKEGDGLSVAFEVADTFTGYGTIAGDNFETVKNAVEQSRARGLWQNFSPKPPPQPIEADLHQSLPPPERFGAEPLAYGQNSRGETLSAYPAIAAVTEYRNGRDQLRFEIRYYASQSEAGGIAEAAEKMRARFQEIEVGRARAEELKARAGVLAGEVKALQAGSPPERDLYELNFLEIKIKNAEETLAYILRANRVTASELEEIVASLSEVETKIADRRRVAAARQAEVMELHTRLSQGEVLVDFTGRFRRMGASGNTDLWVVRPDGSRREPDKVEYRKRYTSEGDKQWRIVEADEIALRWTRGATPEFEVAKVPGDGITAAQLAAVRQIETEVGAMEGGAGLDPEINARNDERVAGIRAAVALVLKRIPEFGYYEVAGPDGVGLEDDTHNFQANLAAPFSEQCDGRAAQLIRSVPAAGGVVEFLAYDKYGEMNYAMRWRPLLEDEPAASIPALADIKSPAASAAEPIVSRHEGDEDLVSPSPMHSLAAAFEKSQDRPVPPPAKISKKSAPPAAVAETKPREEGPPDEEARHRLGDEMALLTALAELVRGIARARKASEPRAVEAQQKMLARAGEVTRSAADLVLAVGGEKARESQITGTVASLRQTLESAVKQNAWRLVEGDAGDWLKAFETAWRIAPETIRENHDAAEYIENRLISRDELTMRVRRELVEAAAAHLLAPLSALPDLIEKVLGEV